MVLTDENSWQTKKTTYSSVPLINTNNLIKIIDRLELIRTYLIDSNFKTYNELNSVKSITESKLTPSRITSNVVFPQKIVLFRDFDRKFMVNTDKYIQLYTAIKNNDVDTIMNLTVLADPSMSIHLCVTNQDNITPFDICLKYNIGLIPTLINIYEQQYIKSGKKTSGRKIKVDKTYKVKHT